MPRFLKHHRHGSCVSSPPQLGVPSFRPAFSIPAGSAPGRRSFVRTRREEFRHVVCAIGVSLAVITAGGHARGARFEVANNLSSGPGSLHQALVDASLNPGVDDVILSNVTGRITLTSPSPIGNTVIRGPGARQLTVAASRLQVPSTAATIISGVRMTLATNLPLGTYGGIISNGGSLLLTECEFSGSGGSIVFGGAVYNAGNLTISRSTFSGNQTRAEGSIYPSPVCGTGNGGGLYVQSGTVQIVNSTFSGNSCTSFLHCRGRGGAIFVASGNVQLVNCTLTGNYAPSGGGIFNEGGVVTLTNTIVTDTTDGVDRSAASNLFTNEVAAGLGPLQDNGGPTLTHALAPDSSAINRGIATGAPSMDQQGVLRPQGSRHDIGACEFERPPGFFELDTAIQGPGTLLVSPEAVFLPSNTLVTVAATPVEDHELAFWSGDAAGRDNPLAVRLDRDKRIVAHLNYALATVIRPPGATNYVVNNNAWGPGSFRQAIRDANASGGGTIRFSNVTGTITASIGLPTLALPIHIIGPPPPNLTLTIPLGVQGFVVQTGVTASIRRITVQSGQSSGQWGGAVANGGNLSLWQVHFLGCSAPNGGAIFNAGTLRAEGCVFTANSASSGGAIYNQGDMVVTDSSFENNRSSTSPLDYHSGGGALYHKTGSAFFARCQFLGNSSSGQSGFYSSSVPTSELSAGSGRGGALYLAGGQLGLVETILSSNVTLGGSGSTDGVSHFSGSGGSALGSGIFVGDGTLGLTNCLLSGNRGTAGNSPSASRYPGGGGAAHGGGVHIESGTLTAVNCTLSANEVRGGITGGGGYLMMPGGGQVGFGSALSVTRGTATVVHCTFYGNRAFGGNYGGTFGTNFGKGLGGGIGLGYYGVTGRVALLNTIISGNSGTTLGTNGIVANDLQGPATSLGHNLVGTAVGFPSPLATDLMGANPLLGPLQDNGGVAPTHALLAGSPALDAGGGSGLPFDGRGQPRVIDNPAVPNGAGGDGSDIGAVEVNHILAATGGSRAGSNVQVRFTTVSDKRYRLQSRPEVAAGPWTLLPGVVAGTGGIAVYTDTNAANIPRRFYRIFEE